MTLRLLFVGIDGAAHPIVQRLLAEGRLPNLAGLAATGAAGELRSTIPPHTAPGWCSLFTGVNPGKHAVYQFWRTQDPDYGAHLVGAQDIRAETLWLTLERLGWSVGAVNVPMTHPPTRLRGGYMVSWPLCRTVHYAEPPDLLRELAAAGGHYMSDLAGMYRGQVDYLAKAEEFVKGRTVSVLHLMDARPSDALMVVYSEVDRVSHHFWGSGEDAPEAVLHTYELIDSALGQLLDRVDDDCAVVVASDHGFGLCRANLQVHELLAQAGLLRTEFVAEERIPPPFDEMYEDPRGRWFTSAVQYRRAVDFDRTRVYMPTPGCFGLNFNLQGRQCRGTVSPRDVRHVRADVAAAIDSVRGPQGDRQLQAVPREDVYRGPFVDRAPDVILLPDRWDVMVHPGLTGSLWEAPTQAGIHREEGILFLRAAGVPAGSTVTARMEDVTPTILTCLGLPVTDGLDGVCLTASTPEVRTTPVALPAPGQADMTDDERRSVEERLISLGYI